MIDSLWGSLNIVDWSLVLIVALFTLWGFFKGLIRGLITLVGIALGYTAASRLYIQVSPFLSEQIPQETTRNILVFIGIFVTCIVIAYIAGSLLRGAIKGIGFAWVDNTLGTLLGLTKGLLVSCVIIIALAAFLPPHSRYIEQSRITPEILSLVEITVAFAPQDLRTLYSKKIEPLKKKWEQQKRETVLMKIEQFMTDDKQTKKEKF